MASSGFFDQHVGRKPRACIPCHKRKVKCNASQAGLPCARCIKSRRIGQCELVRLPTRSAGRKERFERSGAIREQAWSCRELPPMPQGSAASREQQITDPVDATSSSTFSLNASPNHSSSISVAGRAIAEPEDRAIRPVLTDSYEEAVSVEDHQLETCRMIAQWDSDHCSPTRVGKSPRGREILEYHDGVSSITILGELFGNRNPGKFVRILLQEPIPNEQGQGEDIEQANMNFLRQRGAFDLPPRSTCQALLRLYFDCVHPYTPILDHLDFMHKFTDGRYSIFLFQCILTSVVPYMPRQLLLETGHLERSSAQRSFFSKAQLLYDLGAEKSQLCLLQGFLMLTTSPSPLGLDKDCRFWLSNAVRLATQMGLHRKRIAVQLESPTRKLFTRIFWVLYNKDVLMSIAGRANLRRLNDCDCDVAELTEDDWEEEGDLERFQHIISPTTRLQKLYFVQNTRLSQICAQSIEIFRVPDSRPPASAYGDLEQAIFQWRSALPPELHPEIVQDWSHENIWILVLRAMSYRLECVFYRKIRKLCSAGEDSSMRRALQKQQDAMLELDAILDRIMLHNLVSSCPLSITTCASTVVAMHIEIALSLISSCASPQKRSNRIQIHNGLAYLRTSAENWHSIHWTLRMFEVVIVRTGLTLGGSNNSEDGDGSATNPFGPNMLDGRYDNSSTVTGLHPVSEATSPAQRGFSSYAGPDAGLSYDPMLIGEDTERWLDGFLTEDVFEMDSMPQAYIQPVG